jgi:hypothetical protein
MNHTVSKKIVNCGSSIIEIEYPYDYNTKFTATYSANHDIQQIDNINPLSTYVRLDNLSFPRDIYFLDSYLEYFKHSHNTVHLYQPKLSFIYMLLSSKNLYRHQNEFIIFDLNSLCKHENNENERIKNDLLQINHLTNTNIWKFKK